MAVSPTPVALVGPGRLGRHLAQRLAQQGIPPWLVVGRRPAPAQALANSLGTHTQWGTSLQPLAGATGLVLLAVPDAALPTVGEALARLQPAFAGVVAHTSGATAASVLPQPMGQRGVLWPLQTFGDDAPLDWPTIPLILDAETDTPAQAALKELAGQLGGPVHHLASTQRAKLHLAATMAANFTQHLVAQTAALVPPPLGLGVLAPLLQRMLAQTLGAANPASTQTGPAARNDRPTLHRHLQLLQQHAPHLVPLYQALTNSLLENHGHPALGNTEVPPPQPPAEP